MDKVIPALLVAAVTAVTYFAYQHPKGYERIWPYLPFVLIFVTLGLVVWNAAVRLTMAYLIKFTRAEDWSSIDAETEKIQVPTVWLLVAGGITLWSEFLIFLPLLLRE